MHASQRRQQTAAAAQVYKTPWQKKENRPPSPLPAASVLFDLLSSLPPEARARAASLAVDGTSATALLVDARSGEVRARAHARGHARDAARSPLALGPGRRP
jgi:hypothetical protein